MTDLRTVRPTGDQRLLRESLALVVPDELVEAARRPP
jgi:hypothetical protein